MRRHLYLTAIALTVGISAGAFAQGGGGGFGGGGGGGGAGGGSGAGGGGGTSFGGGGGGGTSFGGGGGGTSFSGGGGGTSFAGGGGAGMAGGGNTFSGGGAGMTGSGTGRTGAGGRPIGGSGGFQVSQTNFLSATFSNPMYAGRPGSTSRSPAAAGFGQPSFGSVTSASATSALGGRTGTATVNNRGMTGGLGGLSGQMNTPAISYAATLRFPAPPVVIPAVRAHLQGIISRTSAIRVPGNVRVEAEGEVIVLRGKVADEDEKRLVEGMVRLEPGVREVRNELEISP